MSHFLNNIKQKREKQLSLQAGKTYLTASIVSIFFAREFEMSFYSWIEILSGGFPLLQLFACFNFCVMEWKCLF